MHILFVCTGNICRSPIAAAIARHKINQAGYTDITVASAGTAALSGCAATPEAILVVEENGLNLDDHRARQLTPELIAATDLIVGMKHEHAEHARQMGAQQTTTLSDPVRDPYGRGINAYRETWTSLNSTIPILLNQFRNSSSS
jgi:protein-tyrosine-phosphatase